MPEIEASAAREGVCGAPVPGFAFCAVWADPHLAALPFLVTGLHLGLGFVRVAIVPVAIAARPGLVFALGREILEWWGAA